MRDFFFIKMKIFIHGLESSGSGFKGRFFKEIFFDIITPDFKGDFNLRMQQLENILKFEKHVSIIGSSFGGLMATKYAYDNPQKVNKMVLLAPAIIFENVINESMKISVPTIIYHGKKDNVVPLKETKELAEKIFTNLKFFEVDDDHFLHKAIYKIPWKKIL